MLAMKDQNYIVNASIPGLADFARISIDECRVALQKLSSPDPDSRTQEYEGRRILAVDGGWFIINGEKYDKRVRSRAEYFRERRAMIKIQQNAIPRNTAQQRATPCNSALHKIAPITVTVPVSLTKEKKQTSKPCLREWLEFIKEKNLSITNPEGLFDAYDSSGWVDTQGKPVRNWKLKLHTLAKFNTGRSSGDTAATFDWKKWRENMEKEENNVDNVTVR
jgi:hypothetical protein